MEDRAKFLHGFQHRHNIAVFFPQGRVTVREDFCHIRIVHAMPGGNHAGRNIIGKDLPCLTGNNHFTAHGKTFFPFIEAADAI